MPMILWGRALRRGGVPLGEEAYPNRPEAGKDEVSARLAFGQISLELRVRVTPP